MVSGFLMILQVGIYLHRTFDVVVGEQYEITVDVSIASGNANFRSYKRKRQTRVFNYTDFPNGVTKFITTVEVSMVP